MSTLVEKKLGSRPEFEDLVHRGLVKSEARVKASANRRKLISHHLESTLVATAERAASRKQTLPQIEFASKGGDVIIASCSLGPPKVPIRTGDICLLYDGIEAQRSTANEINIKLRPELVSIHVCEQHESQAYKKLRAAVRAKVGDDKWVLASAIQRLPRPGRSVLVGAAGSLGEGAIQVDDFGIILGSANGPTGPVPVILASWKTGGRRTGCLLEINGKACESLDDAAGKLRHLAAAKKEAICRISSLAEVVSAMEAHRKGDVDDGVAISELGTVVTLSTKEKRMNGAECVVQ